MLPPLIIWSIVAASPPAWEAGSYWPPALAAWPTERATALVRAVEPSRLRAWHELLASEPHVAGSPGDARQIERIAGAFRDLGLEVEVQVIHPLLAIPVSAVLEVIEPGTDGAAENRIPLITKEKILPEDADSSNPDLSWGWNAYSGSGDVTAAVVYANQGTKADFAKLKELGVDCRGKIVICRYGGNFRGYKAKFAQAAGAVGLIIFTDPGKDPGPTYPMGGAPNDTCIERGSVNTLDYPGDPLTPGIEATKEARRLALAELDLPRIPVQPIGYGAAREIMARLASGEPSGPALPEGWQGGLPFAYRVEGGVAFKVRVKVEQARPLGRTANVIGTLRGRSMPEQTVLVGSHHDAWGFGACDPTCGTICTIEAARVFAEAAKAGHGPERTLKFCAWGAEEFSIIGSTEFVESRREEISRSGVAYINLDMSAMGPNFSASASPTLKTIITEVVRRVPAVNSTMDEGGRINGPTVLESWLAREQDPLLAGQPKFGDLGGGSDHVAFWCHAGVPSVGMGAGGARGSAYHSVYDTLAWYRKNVGDDYRPARMVTQVVVATLDRLANDHVPPYDPGRTAHDVGFRLEEIAGRAEGVLPGAADRMRALAATARELAANAARATAAIVTNPAVDTEGDAARSASLSAAFNSAFAAPEGLPGRPWYRNELASPDMDSGYAAWILPRLTRAVEYADAADLESGLARMESALRVLGGTLPKQP